MNIRIPLRAPTSASPVSAVLQSAVRRGGLALSLSVAVAGVTVSLPAHAQQVADSSFVPNVGPPRWPKGTGPQLVLDEAHFNFHTLGGRYLVFGRLATAIGFRIAPLRTTFTEKSLRDVKVLVIANALNVRNTKNNWVLPTPSAFTADEIAAVRRFVEGGGGLLLVADHMPFAGAAEDLGRAIGVQFANGFAYDSYAANANSLMTYRRADGLVSPLDSTPPVDSIVAFTGSAFKLLTDGVPLMKLPKATRIWLPNTAWVFGDSVKSVSGDGWLQGAALNVGRGRVVVMGEAAMLSAQRAGAQRSPMGMNDPKAHQNARFASELLRWLAGDGSAVK